MQTEELLTFLLNEVLYKRDIESVEASGPTIDRTSLWQ
jgi:hypothetical protein